MQAASILQPSRKIAVIVLGLLGVTLVGLLDYFTGEELSILLLYLGPITLVTWRAGRLAGLIMALASSIAWISADLATSHHYTQPVTPYWNTLMLLSSFLVVVFLLSALKVSYAHLEAKVRERTAALESEVTERRRAEDQLLSANVELSKRKEELTRTLEELTKSHAELKATQLQLIEAAKMESVGRLAAGVAHEVKNPLTTISMVGDYISNFLPVKDPESTMMLQDLKDAVQRANRVVSELLEFSRPRELSMKPGDLHASIERSLGMVRLELTRNRVYVQSELAPRLPPLLLDQNKMDQVFINLFMNAIQAMPAGGTLTIRTAVTTPTNNSAEHDTLREIGVEMDDTGIGIPESNLTKIFDPFFTTKPPGHGTGLGLSVVRRIVEMHQGSITIKNRPEGGAQVLLLFKTEF